MLVFVCMWGVVVNSLISIFPVLLSPQIGKFGNRLDMRCLVTISFAVYAGCFFWRSEFTAQMSFWDVFWPQFVQGIGMAMFFMPLTAITLSRMPAHQIASASGISNFVRILCGGIGTSIVTTLWERRSALHHARLTESITPYTDSTTAALNGLQQLGLDAQQQAAALNRTISQQSSIIGSNELFWLGGVLFLLLIAGVWFAKPPFGGGNGGGAH